MAAVKEIGFRRVLKSFLVYDLVTCNDTEYRKLYKNTLEELEQMEVNSKN